MCIVWSNWIRNGVNRISNLKITDGKLDENYTYQKIGCSWNILREMFFGNKCTFANIKISWEVFPMLHLLMYIMCIYLVNLRFYIHCYEIKSQPIFSKPQWFWDNVVLLIMLITYSLKLLFEKERLHLEKLILKSCMWYCHVIRTWNSGRLKLVIIVMFVVRFKQ